MIEDLIKKFKVHYNRYIEITHIRLQKEELRRKIRQLDRELEKLNQVSEKPKEEVVVKHINIYV